MGSITKYLRKIYITVALTLPLFLTILYLLKMGVDGFPFLFLYIFFALCCFMYGIFVIAVMYFILKLTENISKIYTRKIILNVIIVLLIGGFSMLAAIDNYIYYKLYELIGWSLPIPLMLTAAIWYFKLEPKQIPELTEIDHLVE